MKINIENKYLYLFQILLKLNLINFCENKLFVVISNKVKEEINKLGKLSIFVARKPNQKKMIELITEKFLLGKKMKATLIENLIIKTLKL